MAASHIVTFLFGEGGGEKVVTRILIISFRFKRSEHIRVKLNYIFICIEQIVCVSLRHVEMKRYVVHTVNLFCCVYCKFSFVAEINKIKSNTVSVYLHNDGLIINLCKQHFDNNFTSLFSAASIPKTS